MVNESELTCTRFGPTGFPGCVDDEEEEDPPQAPNASVKIAMAHNAHA
jgi:hypothetical protein